MQIYDHSADMLLKAFVNCANLKTGIRFEGREMSYLVAEYLEWCDTNYDSITGVFNYQSVSSSDGGPREIVTYMVL